MLKQLRAFCTFMLLVSMSLLPMNKEVAHVDDYAQAREFHEMLQCAYHGLLQDGVVESYYKKINPITSNPIKGTNRWRICSVSIAGQRINRNATDTYTHGDISFTINPEVDFDLTQPLDVLVTHGEKNSDIQFTKSDERKVPARHSFKSYDDILNAIHNNKLLLVSFINLKGVLNIAGRSSCVILIRCMNQYQQPITLRGMEIICSKDEKATKVFLDFADDENKAAADNFTPIMWEYSITGDKNENRNSTFFDSPETRKKWVPDESNFYDLNRHILTSLPWCFSDHDNRQEPKGRVFDMNDSLYQIPDEVWELIFLAQNKYANIESDMRTERKAAIRWCAMKIIVKTSLVCKRLNAVAQTLLPSYTKEIKGYIDTLGGKNKATNMAFTEDGIWWFKVTEICKAMKVDLNNTKHTSSSGDTLLTRAIRRQRKRQIEQLLLEGADPRQCNQEGEMPIDLAYTNGLLDIARLIKDHGGDPDDKYGYKYNKFAPKQELLDLLNALEPVNNVAAISNNNPPPIPPQTFSLPSWITQSHAYIFVGGISASAVAYWLYTKFTADEDNVGDDDYLEVDAESEEDDINSAQPNTTCV